MATLDTPDLGSIALAGAAAGVVGLGHGLAHQRFGEASALGPAAVGTVGKVVIAGTFVSALAVQSIRV